MRLLLAGLLAAPLLSHAADRCGAFPALRAPALPGWCAAIVARAGDGLRMPRSVLWLGRTGSVDELLVTDMGNWEPRRGRLLLAQVDGATGNTRITEVLSQLERPHGLRRGPDGRIYIGETTRIVRIAWPPPAGQKAEAETVLDQLPAEGRHPLKAFVFAPDGSMYLAVGAASDSCESGGGMGTDGLPQCAEMQGERPQAAVYRVRFAWPEGRVEEMKTFAIGLRNSTALAVSAAGTLLQGENNIDAPQENFPAEEINRLAPGGHYGWPSCVERRKPMPGVAAAACAKTIAPVALMPAHTAPLHMEFSTAGSAQGRPGLLVSWHGYRAAGQRVVRYELKDGLPAGKPRALLGPWSLGANRQGAPVGFAEDAEGRLWIADDRNRMLLRLGPRSLRGR